jgi:hypothetical protein
MNSPTEQTFFKQGQVTVTNTRFIVGSQTYAMRNITSVQAMRNPAKRKHPIELLLFGVVVAGLDTCVSIRDSAGGETGGKRGHGGAPGSFDKKPAP